MLRSDPVWYQDVRVLTRRLDEFWPSSDQSPEERVNSIVRLLAYCTLAVYLYKGQVKHLAFGAVAIGVVSLAYRGGGARVMTRVWARVGGGGNNKRRQGGTAGCGRRAAVHHQGRRHAVGGVRPKHAARAATQCTRSTPSNPFANVLLTDLADNPGRAPACKYDEHQAEIRDNFNRGLVRNVYDIYEKENSQRQFMTMPVTTALPDTVAFANWCYGSAARPTCKEVPGKCTGAFP